MSVIVGVETKKTKSQRVGGAPKLKIEALFLGSGVVVRTYYARSTRIPRGRRYISRAGTVG